MVPTYFQNYRLRLAAGAAFLFLGSASSTNALDMPSHTATVPAAIIPVRESVLAQMQTAFSQIAESVEPAVVNIKADRTGEGGDSEFFAPTQPAPPLKTPSPPLKPKAPKAKEAPETPAVPGFPRHAIATGSGVIVRSDGYILTNDHVVDGSSSVTVTLFDGREFSGKVYTDSRSDLAIVKIDPGSTPLPTAVFADSSAVRPGQWAIAVGSPFDLENTMTVGVISAIGRHQMIPSSGTNTSRYYPDLIQTDAAINPGNSGGPLFNIDGQIVGINVAIESPVEGSAGVGFAIPGDMARRIMELLIHGGKVTRGYLGVSPDDLTPTLRQEFMQKSGAFVRDIRLSSPAGKAGLRAGDIITNFDGMPINGEVALRNIIAATPPGKHVSVDYVRDGHAASAFVTLGAIPSAISEPVAVVPAVPEHAPLKLGVEVREITARDRQMLDVPADTTGLIITSVAPGSPFQDAADRVGLSSLIGTIIQRIGRTPITTKADLAQVLAAASQSNQTSLTIILVYGQDGDIHQSALNLHL